MQTNTLTTNYLTAHVPAGRGPHYLMLGTVVVSQLLHGDETGGQFSLVALTGAPGSGPGPHLDPWRESFYVLEGELTFQIEEGGIERAIIARAGDCVSIPRRIGHAFRVTSTTDARYLIASTPAGIAAFFADAGEPIEHPVLPASGHPFDRARLQAAFAKHGLSPYAFASAGGPASGTCAG